MLPVSEKQTKVVKLTKLFAKMIAMIFLTNV